MDLDRLEDARAHIHRLDWRLYEIVVTPVRELPGTQHDR